MIQDSTKASSRIWTATLTVVKVNTTYLFNNLVELEAELGLNDHPPYDPHMMRKGGNNNNYMTPNVGTNASKGKA